MSYTLTTEAGLRAAGWTETPSGWRDPLYAHDPPVTRDRALGEQEGRERYAESLRAQLAAAVERAEWAERLQQQAVDNFQEIAPAVGERDEARARIADLERQVGAARRVVSGVTDDIERIHIPVLSGIDDLMAERTEERLVEHLTALRSLLAPAPPAETAHQLSGNSGELPVPALPPSATVTAEIGQSIEIPWTPSVGPGRERAALASQPTPRGDAMAAVRALAERFEGLADKAKRAGDVTGAAGATYRTGCLDGRRAAFNLAAVELRDALAAVDKETP